MIKGSNYKGYYQRSEPELAAGDRELGLALLGAGPASGLKSLENRREEFTHHLPVGLAETKNFKLHLKMSREWDTIYKV